MWSFTARCSKSMCISKCSYRWYWVASEISQSTLWKRNRSYYPRWITAAKAFLSVPHVDCALYQCSWDWKTHTNWVGGRIMGHERGHGQLPQKQSWFLSIYWWIRIRWFSDTRLSHCPYSWFIQRGSRLFEYHRRCSEKSGCVTISIRSYAAGSRIRWKLWLLSRLRRK